MSKRSIRIFGCGGAGTNQAKYFLEVAEEAGFAALAVSLVDTSDSNLGQDLKKENVYLLDGVDGAGKKRSEHSAAIANTVKQVLVEHKPADLNIVVFSASGGSGSVFGPLLIAEMLDRDIPVIGIVIGSNSTAIEAQNTVKTLETLDHISRKRNKPAVISYEQNSKLTPRRDVDNAVRASIRSLQMLVGTLGGGSGLDTSDLTNWLYYSNVTDVPAQLSLLEIVLTADAAQEIEDPISVASIITQGNDAEFPFSADYGCEGFKSDKVATDVSEAHFVIATEAVPAMYRQAADIAGTYAEKKASRPTQASLVAKGTSTDAGDLIL